MSSQQKLALIGCGLMGHGIAKNLLKAGHALDILDHPGNQPCGDLTELGASMTGNWAALLKDKDAVFLVLPGSNEVEAVVQTVAPHLTTSMIVIDATSAEPERTLKVARAVQETGAAYVDAAMTRTPKEAEEGRLNVLMGGTDEDVARAKVLIEAYAENIYHGGSVSSGHRLKLLHNFVSIGQAVIISEAIAAAMRGGVDTGVLNEVLATGGAGGVALERLRPFIADKDTSSFRFAIANAAKDLGYYTDMAATMGASRISAEAVSHVLNDALDKSGPGKVMPELIEILAKD